MTRIFRALGALALVPSLAFAGEATQRAVDRGVAVSLDVAPRAVRDGDTLHVAFTLRDETTGTPLTGAHPTAWLAARTGATAAGGRDCVADAARFLGGALNDRAAVDFNDFYVLALNDDPSISVVDPRFSFGGSQLLTLIALESRGDDWALTPDGSTLFVVMPDVGKVAVAEMNSWKIRRNVAAGAHPSRVVLQPDGARAWIVADDGVSVIETSSLDVVKRIPGQVHAIAFSSDSHTAFVAQKDSLAIVDTRSLAASPRIVRGVGTPRLLAWSSAAQLLYLADPATGRISALDPHSGKLVAKLMAKPGFTQLRFSPDGRYAFLPNPTASVVQILDASSNRIVHDASIADGPDQVTFTDRLAFIRRRGSDAVMMIPLQRLGTEGGIGLADFTGGQHPLGAGHVASAADSIVEAPDAPAVLVANPADRSIYYYKEGMAAPMGGFSNYSREPRAVLVVDRALREHPGGVYATSAKVDDPGAYDVVFFLDSPRVVSCFPLTVAERPETRAKRMSAAIVEPLEAIAAAHAGAPAHIRFRIADAATRQTRAAGDVEVVVMEAPGIWQRRTVAKPSSDGTYQVDVTPPDAGTYYVFVASAAAGLPINNTHFITFEVD